MSEPAFLHPFSRVDRQEFIRLVSGDGAVVVDADGKRYVDALASLWYCNVGHGRREIAEAVAAQLHTLDAFHCYEPFTNEPVDALCERVAASAPMERARVFLTCSGSEAVDSALKLARLAHATAGEPQRTVIASRAPSYHGVTYGGLTCTGLPPNQEGFGPLVGDVVQVPKDDLEALAGVFEEHPGKVAAVIAEPVIGAGGVYPPAPGYLEAARRLCDAHGAWLILDEVVCGFGRLGTWWAAQHYDVRPDLVTFAKGITAGYIPLGGVLVGPAVLDALAAEPGLMLRHGHTYSGHPSACAAGLATLDILERERLIERVPAVGKRLAEGLREVAADGLVAEVRGEGAVWAVGLHEGDEANAVRDGMLTRGVIARPIGSATIAFCPPFVIEEEQVDACVRALADTLAERRAG